MWVKRGIFRSFLAELILGGEVTVKAMCGWLGRMDVQTLCVEPVSPWENGYSESFSGKLRDELFNGEVFHTLRSPGDDRKMAATL